MNRGEILTFIGVITAVCIPIVVFLYRRYFVGGFLTIKVDFSNGVSAPKDIIKPHFDDVGYIIRDKSIVRHDLTWTYKVTITNNSDSSAYFPRLLYKNELFPNITIENLEELKPIGSGKSVVLKVKFFELSDTLPTQRKRTNEPPKDFDSLELLLEYYNSNNAKFFTLYKNTDKINRQSKLKPKF